MAPLRRRSILTAAAAAASVAAIGVPAQQRPRPVVALLSGARQSDTLHVVEALVAELRALGHVDGQTIELDARYADYSAAQGQRLAAEIAARKPAVIVANGHGIELAFRLSPPLPWCSSTAAIRSMPATWTACRGPGRHATGISLMALDLIAKRMEFLTQLRPRLKRLALLASPEHAGQQRELAASRAGAAAFGLEVLYHEARTPGRAGRRAAQGGRRPAGGGPAVLRRPDVRSARVACRVLPGAAGYRARPATPPFPTAGM